MASTPDLPTRRWPFVVGIAAFALALTVGPIIATSGIDAGGSAAHYAAGNTGMVVARAAAGSDAAAPAANPTAIPAFVEVTPTTAAPAQAGDDPAAIDRPAPAPEEPLDGGSISVALQVEPPELEDGDTARWTITVSNDGDAYLWGVYAFFEGIGPVPCANRQLDVGASTTCTADGPVWAGTQASTAWATAWTTLRMVEGQAILTYDVGT
ncbi:MAG: hypothetical protein KQH83_02445 [Actinobacteria bacterium]|nr:hypothetical protein [Actinomycetota bacterium]